MCLLLKVRQDTLGFSNRSLLIGLVAAMQQHVNNLAETGEINPVPRPDENPHFTYPCADRSAVSPIAIFCLLDSSNDDASGSVVLQVGEPGIKLPGTSYCVLGHLILLYPNGYTLVDCRCCLTIWVCVAGPETL
ncbi:hypothetical protein ACVW0A_002968 [Pseudomonas sp. TE3610]